MRRRRPSLIQMSVLMCMGLSCRIASEAWAWTSQVQRQTRVARAAEEWCPDRCRMKDLKVGMELKGKRGRYMRFGVFVDVGAEREGFLHVNEWGDGFPEEQKFARNVGRMLREGVSDGVECDGAPAYPNPVCPSRSILYSLSTTRCSSSLAFLPFATFAFLVPPPGVLSMQPAQPPTSRRLAKALLLLVFLDTAGLRLFLPPPSATVPDVVAERLEPIQRKAAATATQAPPEPPQEMLVEADAADTADDRSDIKKRVFAWACTRVGQPAKTFGKPSFKVEKDIASKLWDRFKGLPSRAKEVKALKMDPVPLLMMPEAVPVMHCDALVKLANDQNLSVLALQPISEGRTFMGSTDIGRARELHRAFAIGEATMLVYLSTVPKGSGGETHFGSLGVSVQPQKGSAILWPNVNDIGSPEKRTIHSGRPVEGKKVKYAMNIWIYGRKQPDDSWIRWPR
eukprot:g28517.t1